MPDIGQELSSLDFASMLGGPLLAAVDAQAQAAISTVNFIKEVGFKPPASAGGPSGDPIYVSFRYPREVAPYQPAVSAHVTGITVTAGGSGYDPDTTVTLSGGGGSGATATVDVDGTGKIIGVSVIDPGSGYTSAPTVSFQNTGGGTGATLTAAIGGASPAVAAVFQEMRLEVPILTLLPIPYIRIEDVTIDFNAKINSIEYKKVDTSLSIDAALQVQQRWPGGSAKLNVSASYKRSTQEGNSVDRTYSLAVRIHAVQDEIPAGMEKVLSTLDSLIRAQPV
ncbi:MAG TPA: DUF2589 domain-containing protein [Longimicrobiaceae bacterium]